MISAVARNRRISASPFVSFFPLLLSAAREFLAVVNRAAPGASKAAPRPSLRRKDRRATRCEEGKAGGNSVGALTDCVCMFAFIQTISACYRHWAFSET